jgi:hypothetical protein
MNYCKIEMGGQERGLKFNNLALIVMSEKASKEFPDATAAYAMVYGGLVGNAYAKGVEVDFTMEQVMDWVDALTTDQVNTIAEAFKHSEAYKKTEEYQTAVDETKKKEKPKPVTIEANA